MWVQFISVCCVIEAIVRQVRCHLASGSEAALLFERKPSLYYTTVCCAAAARLRWAGFLLVFVVWVRHSCNRKLFSQGRSSATVK